MSVHLWNWPKKGARVSVSLVTFSEQKNIQTKWKWNNYNNSNNNDYDERKNNKKYIKWMEWYNVATHCQWNEFHAMAGQTTKFVEMRLDWIVDIWSKSNLFPLRFCAASNLLNAFCWDLCICTKNIHQTQWSHWNYYVDSIWIYPFIQIEVMNGRPTLRYNHRSSFLIVFYSI